jgi:hypothetical protein
MAEHSEHDLETFQNIAIIVRYQDAPLHRPFNVRRHKRVCRRPSILQERQLNGEFTSFAKAFAMGLDTASMHFNQALRQGQTYAETAFGLHTR